MNEKAAMINITAAFLSLFFKELSLKKHYNKDFNKTAIPQTTTSEG